MSNIPEVDVQRRRKGERPTQQAQAPVRRGSQGSQSGQSGSDQSGGGGFLGGGGGGGGLPGGGLLGGGGGKVGCGGVILLLLAVAAYVLFSGGGGLLGGTGAPSGDQQPVDQQPLDLPPAQNTQPTQLRATPTPRATLPPSTGKAGTWLVMLYQDGDDQALEEDIQFDMNEVERAGSTDKVTVVAQIDRFRGGFTGNDNFNSTRRYLVTHDEDLNTIGSEMLADLGEANMADGATLVDFATWAMQTYPADHYALILSDHGMGWPGGWSDPAPGATDPGRAPLVSMNQEDSLYLSEIDDALAQVQSATGVEKLDLIGLDACLMSQLEVYTMLQPYAHYAVASEETEPGLGWAYASFLEQLGSNPAMDGAALASAVVDAYIDRDERVVDDQARQEFLSQSGSTGGFFGVSRVSAEQLAGQLVQGVTLTAVNLDELGGLTTRFNAFAYAMQNIDQQAVASARNYAQSYTSIFGRQVPPSYIDLGHFVQLVAKQANDSSITQAASGVLDALGRVVIAERHGQNKPGSTGLAIYFPNSTLYRSPYTGMQSYTIIAERFTRASLWDDFLVYHYNDRTFKADAAEPVTPSSGGVTRAPGSGDITISQMTASAKTVSPGNSIQISAVVSGNNVGYVMLFTGIYDAQSNSIYVADTDYLESAETAQLNDVFYPVWPAGGTFKLNFDFEPLLFSITDGSQSTLALFNPVAYGASADQAVYAVEGKYTFSGSGEQRKAEMLFKGGKLFQVFGFQGSDTAAAPSEITPAAGDSFTVAQKWMELDSSGQVTQIVYEDGDTLTFTDAGFQWEQVYAPAGDYLVGFIVSDLDGNLSQAYTQIKVQ